MRRVVSETPPLSHVTPKLERWADRVWGTVCRSRYTRSALARKGSVELTRLRDLPDRRGLLTRRVTVFRELSLYGLVQRLFIYKHRTYKI